MGVRHPGAVPGPAGRRLRAGLPVRRERRLAGRGETAPLPDFAKICADTAAEDGSKRVALVIDPGTAADAPQGETPPPPRTACARVPKDASSAEALASVAKPLRYGSDALLCAISGYPVAGCGEQVSGTTGTESGRATASAPTSASASASGSGGSGGGPSAGVLFGVGAVLLLGIAAVAQARRRRG